jgi:hypothetical protein
MTDDGAPYTYVKTKAFPSHFDSDTMRNLPDIETLQDAGLLSKEKLLPAISCRSLPRRPLTMTIWPEPATSLLTATQIPKPSDEQAFERACVPLWCGLLKDPNVQKNARRGQGQDGVDLYGMRDRDPHQ